MKRSLLPAALILAVAFWAVPATADIYCGLYCSGTPGNGVCQGPGVPTDGCTYVGGVGNCMDVSSSTCGGDPGCGFDDEFCPKEPWNPIP